MIPQLSPEDDIASWFDNTLLILNSDYHDLTSLYYIEIQGPYKICYFFIEEQIQAILMKTGSVGALRTSVSSNLILHI